jgi:hypothetical protein
MRVQRSLELMKVVIAVVEGARLGVLSLKTISLETGMQVFDTFLSTFYFKIMLEVKPTSKSVIIR